MDSILNNDDLSQHIETRWDRIEQRHINSTILHDQSDTAEAICKDFIDNKEFITGNHLKALLGEIPKQFSLDPNLVMDLRHSKLRRRNKCTTSVSRRRAKSFLDERLHIRKMFEMNREIQKYKTSLENIRPKSKEPKTIDLDRNCDYACSLGSLKFDIPCHTVGDVENIFPQSCCVNEIEKKEIESKADKMENEMEKRVEEHRIEDQINLMKEPLPSFPIPSQYLIDESYSTNGVDINEPIASSVLPSYIHGQQAHSSTHTLQKPMSPIQSSEEFQFIINPTIMVNIQDTIRPNVSPEFDYGQAKFRTNPIEFHRQSKIAVNQHMSISIKKLSNDEKSTKDSFLIDSEGNCTITDLFNQKTQDNFLLLQKYFLRWIHFNTIEKLKRRNPAQTRLQKMEAFLHNITTERKRALNKLRRPGNLLVPHHSDDYRRMALPEPHIESPRLLVKSYNNKLRTQQDIIDLQKLKLQRQQRVITELKLSKLLDDTNEAEQQLKEELGIVAKNGCANSRSKAKCLQIASNLKDKDEREQSDELQAKGTKAPKFIIEMQARAMERQIRHREAQSRREALEREKEAIKLAAEEEKRQLDEQAKRERIRQYWRKRREEKELEAQKTIDRMRFLENVERAKLFDRERLLKWAVGKLRNLVKWKIRNKKVSNEFRYRILGRDYLQRWRVITAKIWTERKAKADACYDLHCKMVALASWQQYFLVAQSKKLVADDWFNFRLSERVFRAWDRITAQTRLTFEIKQKQADTHFTWYMKWKVLEHWRRLHAILKIEKETLERRKRWRNKVFEFIPDYAPNDEFI